MNTTPTSSTVSTQTAIPPVHASTISARRPKSLLAMVCLAFLAILRRDFVVAARGFVPTLIQALTLPVFFLFIFGRVLPQTGVAVPGYGALLLPGMVAATLLMMALTTITLPLVLDIGNEREIEDRLLAPLPVTFVAIEKVLFAALNSLIAGALVFPLAYLILGSEYHMRSDAIGTLICIMILAALAGASLGLTLGTAVKPEQIGMVNAVVLMPIMFTGCTYFAWGALDTIKWFQVITLFNPLTYSAEGLRGVMTPSLLHGHTLVTLDIHWVLLGLVATIVIFLSIGVKGFKRRAVR